MANFFESDLVNINEDSTEKTPTKRLKSDLHCVVCGDHAFGNSKWKIKTNQRIFFSKTIAFS